MLFENGQVGDQAYLLILYILAVPKQDARYCLKHGRMIKGMIHKSQISLHIIRVD